ncbi:MAG: polyketide cyclase [Rhizobium sp.]|nr:polyketide cyclase [Rhizobium sp.]
MDDLTHYLGAVVRTVRKVDRDGQLARVVLATRTYPTDIADLWDALTNIGRIPRWFLPISGELRLGGRYQLEGNAGGEITECQPPKHLALTWEYGGNISWVTVTLQAETDSRTMLTLEHAAHVPDDFWEKFGAGATGVGWDLGLMGLALHIEKRATTPPEENAAWMASEDGRNFMRLSSDHWCVASIEDGEDGAWARAAAERTRQFYSGEGPEEPG